MKGESGGDFNCRRSWRVSFAELPIQRDEMTFCIASDHSFFDGIGNQVLLPRAQFFAYRNTESAYSRSISSGDLNLSSTLHVRMPILDIFSASGSSWKMVFVTSLPLSDLSMGMTCESISGISGYPFLWRKPCKFGSFIAKSSSVQLLISEYAKRLYSSKSEPGLLVAFSRISNHKKNPVPVWSSSGSVMSSCAISPIFHHSFFSTRI